TVDEAVKGLVGSLGENMLTSDGEIHSRLTRIMRPPFQAGGAADHAAVALPDLYDSLIDGFYDDGRCDLMSAYAEPLAVMSLQSALGLDTCSWQELAGWCRGVCTGIANMENDPTLAATADQAKQELGAALDLELAAIGNGDGRSGALAHFVRAGLDRAEIVNNVRLMVSGGINEPRDGVGLVVRMLLSESDLAARVEEDPVLLRKVIEETLRLHSPVGTITRQVTTDTTLAGVDMPRGDMVSGVLSSANRDPRRWTDPDRFDVDRREGPHMSFATGAHRCLGEWLGRQEIRVGVQRLLARLPDLRPSPGFEADLRGFEFRGPTSLLVEWTPRP
ncbi:MAG: cytochrome P450, partial [Acidimicrobiales bacterium]